MLLINELTGAILCLILILTELILKSTWKICVSIFVLRKDNVHITAKITLLFVRILPIYYVIR